jgi:hypothetical protein
MDGAPSRTSTRQGGDYDTKQVELQRLLGKIVALVGR